MSIQQASAPAARGAASQVARSAPSQDNAAPPALPAPIRATEPPAARHDLLGRQLARAVRERNAHPVLQRAIIAIKGASEAPSSVQTTTNCLKNLKLRATRGGSMGPSTVAAVNASAARPALRAGEALYILAHGSGTTVGGMDPAALGSTIVGWYGSQWFDGKIKLVACYSAKPNTFGGARTYAEELALWFKTNSTAAFTPASVDGIIAIGWADEATSKQVSISDTEWDIVDKRVDKNFKRTVGSLFAETDDKKRRLGLESEFPPSAGTRATGTTKPGAAPANPAKIRYIIV